MNSARGCYLAEWYGIDAVSLDEMAATLRHVATDMSASGCPLNLCTLLAVPSDEVIFGVFTAGSAVTVSSACDRAGHPPQRLTPAQFDADE